MPRRSTNQNNPLTEPKTYRSPEYEALPNPDPDCAAILDEALEQVEGLLRRKIEAASQCTESEVVERLYALQVLVEERLQRVEARLTRGLAEAAPPARRPRNEEPGALPRQTYEAFLRDNPGKAHFTRKQWEKARLVELAEANS